MMVETYLRRGKRELQRLALEPGVQRVGSAGLYLGSGFLLSAASLGASPLPLAMGVICALSGWRAVLMTLGAMIGYPVFWGAAGCQGIVWAAVGGTLAVLVGNREIRRDQPLMIPAIASFLVAVAGLTWRFFLGDRTPMPIWLLRVGMTLFSAAVFTKAALCRDALTDWLAIALGALALAQVAPVPWLGLGFVLAGAMGVGGAFPAAVLTGLALDLAQVTRVPMAAAQCMAYFVRLIPFDKKWQRGTAPAVSYMLTMAACGTVELLPLPALLAGGAIGTLLPPRPQLTHRRGETGTAQVRLELGAEVMRAAQGLILEMEPPPIDQDALLDKVRQRACDSCSARRSCKAQLSRQWLMEPLAADCRKQGRLVPELRRAREELCSMQADRHRQGEYRQALARQYAVLSDYLRSLSDRLPRRGEALEIRYRAEVSARSRQKEAVNGDRCVAFAGPDETYYVLLCDGMGTGPGAAQESRDACKFLRSLLTAGFPAEYSLRTLNDLLALRGSAGAVTVDLAQLRLDTGGAAVYKWGAAPSWVLTRQSVTKIGTAAPPPGLSVSGARETVEKLSLCRGEVLILLSDGVDGEAALRHLSLTPDAPPGELAAKILENGSERAQDDATAAVVRLRPMASS